MRYRSGQVLALLLVALMEGNWGAEAVEAEASALQVVRLSQKH